MCQEGWECEDCAYNKGRCTYEEEYREVNIQEIADQIEQQVSAGAKKDAEAIKSREPEDFWQWWGRTSPPDSLKQREPINAMSGAINFGGGNSSRVKKSKKGNKPTVYVWGETL